MIKIECKLFVSNIRTLETISIIYTMENVFVKNNVSYSEYLIHKNVYDFGKNRRTINVPKIISYNEQTKTLTLQKLKGETLSHEYGENFEDVPTNITDKIRDIISELYLSNIYYPDITGYNFMYIKGKIWMYDFEHAVCARFMPEDCSFVRDFIQGQNQWNPDFQ
jgi:hypothetical protein